MLVTELYNGQGLGNQLFCYVVTRTIAADSGYRFGILRSEKFKGKDFLDLDFGDPVIGGTGPEGGPPTRLPVGIKYYYNERRISHSRNGADLRTFDTNLVTVPDHTKLDGIMQDERYILHRKDEIRQWLKVKGEFECDDYASDDICVINFRGGEYVNVPELFLTQKYWNDAVTQMRSINENFCFVVITDDVKTAKKFFPSFEVAHFDVAKDYSIINKAHYLIISNSSFAWFPTWLNNNLKLCIAPKYWARHNISDGYWSCTYNITSGWSYLDRDGKLCTYESCQDELKEYMDNHQQIFSQQKIKKNFLVVTSYRNDLSWVPLYSDNYAIYDRSEEKIYPPGLDEKKVVRQPNVGYNCYDYFTYIIDNYNNLPDNIIFMKGNTVPRHVSREYFDRIANNDYLTPIEDYRMHKESWPICFFAPDGGFCEINNSWYLHHHQTKYFHAYNDFLRYCFKDPLIPRYNRFAPGANYIVPKEHILKYPKIFYENLCAFISHSALPGESHIIERALHTLWTCNFEINEKMLLPIDDSFIPIPPIKAKPSALTQLIRLVKSFIPAIFFRKSEPDVDAMPTTPMLRSRGEIAKYRKKIKIYDIFTFFNELELLQMRLEILNPHVDYFVIIECTETFSGKPKKLFYAENEKLFAKYKDKIIHYVTNEVPATEAAMRARLNDKKISKLDREIINSALISDNVPPGQLHWLKEFYQKESIKKALLGLHDDDICFIGDVDEIWSPGAIIDYERDDIFKLCQDVYVYYLNNRSNEPWAGTLVAKYKHIKNACLNHLRTASKTKYTYIKDGGWHFTNQGGTKRIRQKLESYGHQEFNNEVIKSDLENKIKANKDFIGRNFRFSIDESGLPDYLLQNKEKYKDYFKAC